MRRKQTVAPPPDPAGEVSPAAVAAALELAGVGRDRGEVQAWSPGQRREAYEWAIAVALGERAARPGWL